MDRVTTHVHRGPSGEVEVPARVGCIGVREGHVNVDVRQLTQFTRARQLEHALHDGVVPVMECLHELHTGSVHSVSNVAGLGGVAGRGLFAQDVLAGRDRSQVPRPMQAIRKRVVDRLDLRVVDHFLIGVHDSFDVSVLGEFLGSVSIAGSNHHQTMSGVACRFDDGLVADARGPQNSDS